MPINEELKGRDFHVNRFTETAAVRLTL